jgi:hypothetical protein
MFYVFIILAIGWWGHGKRQKGNFVVHPSEYMSVKTFIDIYTETFEEKLQLPDNMSPINLYQDIFSFRKEALSYPPI